MSQLLSKEEILEKNNAGVVTTLLNRYSQLLGHKQNFYKSMEEYAKQEAIEFNEWCEYNRFMKHRGRWYDTKHDGKSWGTFPSYTKEELYNLYQQSKQP